MLHTRTSIEYRDGSAAIAPVIGAVDRSVGEFSSARARLAVERAMDDVLADSFPASDPPSWDPGVARPDSVVSPLEHDVALAVASTQGRANGGVDVSRPMSAERTFLQGLVSLAGAAGIALLVPFAILIVGLPVVLAVRGVLEVIAWLFGVALQ